jgi:hypothetical protein
MTGCENSVFIGEDQSVESPALYIDYNFIGVHECSRFLQLRIKKVSFSFTLILVKLNLDWLWHIIEVALPKLSSQVEPEGEYLARGGDYE